MRVRVRVRGEVDSMLATVALGRYGQDERRENSGKLLIRWWGKCFRYKRPKVREPGDRHCVCYSTIVCCCRFAGWIESLVDYVEIEIGMYNAMALHCCRTGAREVVLCAGGGRNGKHLLRSGDHERVERSRRGEKGRVQVCLAVQVNGVPLPARSGGGVMLFR